ncbi:MAG: hypothetical protein ACK4YP_14950, partial [Myxococcota bacterium]
MAPMLLAMTLLACTSGPDLNKGKAEMVVSPARVDFGEVVLRNYVTVRVRLQNEGYGTLLVDDVALGDGTSPDFAVVSFPEEVRHGEEGYVGTDRYPRPMFRSLFECFFASDTGAMLAHLDGFL